VKIAAVLLRIAFRLTIWGWSTVSPVDRRRQTANIYVRQRGGAENLNTSRGRSRLGALLILISVAFALFCLRMARENGLYLFGALAGLLGFAFIYQHFGLAQSVRESRG
jgi:hypothetical protein